MTKEAKCHWSPTLGDLEGTAEETWGTTSYNPETDREKPCVFFGVYGLPDFYTLWRHKGKRWILWAGTDILHLRNNYWLDGEGKIRVDHVGMCKWMNEYCENWCENERERDVLSGLGIQAKICPSFLGNVNKFDLSFKPGNKVYLSCSGENFVQYGWDLIEEIAGEVPEIDFYLYGSNNWKTSHKNVIIRGRVNKEIMNEEIAGMQAGLRPLEFDGASEIVVKSLLQGQHTISRIEYPFVDSYKTKEELIALLKDLPNKQAPNLRAREWFLNNINQYPWNNA